MVPRLLTFWRGLRSSLWALPLLMVVVAACAAILAVHFPIQQGEDPVWFLYSGDAEEAPQFLSDLVTAMITMATLVVSITMVVLTLAAQQLGPRLIRNFMADRRTQLTLGLFVATVVYLLLVLRSTYGGAKDVPNLAVTGGTALVLLCLIALLVFVHHLARSIIADTIIDRVGSALDDDIERLLIATDHQSNRSQAACVWEHGAPLTLSNGGYIEAIDHGSIVDIAREVDAVSELSVNVGDHILPGCIFAKIVPRKAANEELRNRLEECLVLSGERASIQDLETSIRQLVEVALRALSPSVSDPFSAMAAIDRLTRSFAAILHRSPPQHVWADEDDIVRLIVPQRSFADLVDVAYGQIRQQAKGQSAVLISLVENFGQLLAQADGSQRKVMQKQIELVVETGRQNIAQREDLKALELRARLATAEKAFMPGVIDASSV